MFIEQNKFKIKPGIKIKTITLCDVKFIFFILIKLQSCVQNTF